MTLFSVWECWWLAPLAVAMDLALGDPQLPWRHPVCAVGRLLDILERPARRCMEQGSPGRKAARGRLAGAVALVILVGAVCVVTGALIALPVLGTLAAIYLAWAGLAMGSLLSTGREVLIRVEHSAVGEARQALSWLVSRETADMERPLMRKTLADTLSENLTDAFVAPLFWLLVAGPIGLWGYKAVSTADSMWGYVTEKWRFLGWAGARADDVLAFVPARISVCLVFVTDVVARIGVLRGTSRPWTGHWPGWHVLAQQARGMPSPNSGWSMTACAWLCGARMAGPSVYFGTYTPKPWLGPDVAHPWDAERLKALCSLLRRTAIVGGAVLCLAFLSIKALTGAC